MPDHQIIALSKIAGENSGFWLAAIAAEQSQGETSRAWAKLASTLSRAAVLLIAIGLFAQSHVALAQCLTPDTLNIMRTARKLRRIVTRWLARLSHGHASPALLVAR